MYLARRATPCGFDAIRLPVTRFCGSPGSRNQSTTWISVPWAAAPISGGSKHVKARFVPNGVTAGTSLPSSQKKVGWETIGGVATTRWSQPEFRWQYDKHKTSPVLALAMFCYWGITTPLARFHTPRYNSASPFSHNLSIQRLACCASGTESDMVLRSYPTRQHSLLIAWLLLALAAFALS
jgi:hypothetical protein